MKPEILTIFLYPRQQTSACIFHSYVQFPFHKVFIPSSLSQRKGWCLPIGQWNICPSAFGEICTFSTFRLEQGAHHSPLPWISEWTPGGYSDMQPMAHSAEIVLFSLQQASHAYWHMLNPRIPLFYPYLLSPFLIFLTGNSPGSCFSFRKSVIQQQPDLRHSTKGNT